MSIKNDDLATIYMVANLAIFKGFQKMLPIALLH